MAESPLLAKTMSICRSRPPAVVMLSCMSCEPNAGMPCVYAEYTPCAPAPLRHHLARQRPEHRRRCSPDVEAAGATARPPSGPNPPRRQAITASRIARSTAPNQQQQATTCPHATTMLPTSTTTAPATPRPATRPATDAWPSGNDAFGVYDMRSSLSRPSHHPASA